MLKKIESFQDLRKFARVRRKISKSHNEKSFGYILDHSDDFLVLQHSDDFRALGFYIFPIAQISKIQHKKRDAYYDKIMGWDGEKDNIALKTTLDLTSWQSIFNTFKLIDKPIIIECEGADLDFFNIGPIVEVKEDSVELLHFDTMGNFEESPAEIFYEDITCVQFDDRYVEVFYKYIVQSKE